MTSQRRWKTLVQVSDWPLVLLIWLGIVAAMLYGYQATIVDLVLPDPDDALRLVQVRDLLAGQAWYDLTQYRINAAEGGGQLHWSRFIDAQIASLILLFRFVLVEAEAERWAIALYPLLLLLPVLFVFRALLAHLGNRSFVITGLLVAATTFSFLHYFVPLRIDHHGWQLLLSLAMLWLAMGPATRARGLAAALVISAHVEVSLEGLPYLVIFGGLFAVDWLRDPNSSPRLRGFASGLIFFPLLWIVAWRGPGAVTDLYCDAFSRPFVAGAMVTGLTLVAGMHFLRSQSTMAGRLVVLGIAALAGGAAFVAAGPECLAGPFGNLSPLVRTLWYESINEGRPIWGMSTQVQVSFLAPTLVGFAGLLWSARKMAGTPQATDWNRLVLVAVGSIILSTLVLRATAVTHAYLVPGYVLMVLGIFRWGRSLSTALLRIPATAAAIVALPISVSAAAVTVMMQFEQDDMDVMPTDCITPAAERKLAALPKTTIFAALDFSPSILVATPHSVVASGHHRNHQAIHRVLAAFMLPGAQAEKRVRETGAEYLAICRNLPEHLTFVKHGPNGLAAAIHRNAPPAWLKLEPAHSLGPLQVFRVLPPVTPPQPE